MLLHYFNKSTIRLLNTTKIKYLGSSMYKSRKGIFALTLLAFCILPIQSFAAMIGFDMETYNVSPGETFDVSIIVSSFSGVNISGGGVVLTQDVPSLITANSVNVLAPNGIGDGVFSPAIDNTMGRIDEIAFADFGGVDGDDIGSFILSTISFTAGTSIGSTILSLMEFQLNPFSGNDIASNDPVLSIPLDFTNATVNVVPIPAAVWLLGSALVGLFGLSRRKITI